MGKPTIRLAAVFAALVCCMAAQVRAVSPAPATRPAVDGYGDALPAGAVARIGTVRLRSGQPITMLAFSPDKKVLASSVGSEVTVWEIPDGRESRRLKVDSPVRNLQFSPDGKLLAVVDSHVEKNPGMGPGPVTRAIIHLFSASTGAEVRRIGVANNDVVSTAWSPDGKVLVSGLGLGGIALHTAEDGALTATIDRNPKAPWYSGASWITLSPNGATAVTVHGSGHGTYTAIWDLAGRSLRYQSSDRGSPALATRVSANGRSLTSLLYSGKLHEWDISPGRKLEMDAPEENRDGRHEVKTAVFSPDGSLAAIASRPDNSSTPGPVQPWYRDTQVELLEVATGHTRGLGSRTHDIRALIFSSDGKMLAAAGADGCIWLWDTGNGKLLNRQDEPAGQIQAVAISPDGGTVASGAGDALLRLHSLPDGKTRAAGEGHEDTITALAFSPDGRSVASLSRDGTLRLWDQASMTSQASFAYDKLLKPAQASLAWSDDARFLGAALNERFLVWDISEKRAFEGSLDPKYRRQFAASLRFYAQGLRPPALLCADWSLLAGLRGPGEMPPQPGTTRWTGAALSPDNQRLLLWHANTLEVLETATQKELTRITGDDPRDPRQPVCLVRHALYSPDGTRIVAVQDATASAPVAALGGGQAPRDQVEQIIHVWDAASGKELGSFHGHRGRVNDLQFSRNGRLLLSASQDNTVLVWDFSPYLRTPIAGSLFPPPATRSVAAPTTRTAAGSTTAPASDRPGRIDAGGVVHSLSLSPKGDLLAVGMADGTIVLRTLPKGEIAKRLQAHKKAVLGVAFSPDGQRLASASADQPVRVWDVARGSALAEFESRDFVSVSHYNLAWSPDSERLAAAGSEVARVWNVRSRKFLFAFDLVHQANSTALVFTPDDKLFSLWPSRVMVRDGRSGEPPPPFDTINVQEGGDALSHDGRLVSRDRSLLEPITMTFLTTLGGGESAGLGHAPVLSVFSRDGKRLANFVEKDRQIVVWDIHSASALTKLSCDGSVNGMVFTPAGEAIVAGGDSGVIQTWALPKPAGVAEPKLPAADQVWEALTARNGDYGDLYRALVSNPKQSLPMIATYYRQSPKDNAQVLALIKKFDGAEAGLRHSIAKQLVLQESFSRAELPLLRAAMDPDTSHDVKDGVEETLAQLQLHDHGRCMVRVILALEEIGTQEAAALIERAAVNLSKPHGGAVAAAALQRMKQRQGAGPNNRFD